MPETNDIKDPVLSGEPTPGVVTVAKKRTVNPDEPITLSTGVRAILRPVSASLISEVMATVEDPEIPTWEHPDKGRVEPNPDDPTYLKELSKAEQRRGQASVDAVIMFGVELVDPLPVDGHWLKKLKFMAKRGMVKLDDFDLDDELDMEFLFKRYVAVANEDIVTIGRLSGLNQEALQEAERSF